MSKASQFAKLHHELRFNLDEESAMMVNAEGKLYFYIHRGETPYLSPPEALKVRDWLTDTFNEAAITKAGE